MPENICDKIFFSKFYNKYAQPLSKLLYYKYGNRSDPTDKVQDAFTKLWENCSKINPKVARSYLFTTANNMMLNELKHEKVVLKYRQVKPKDYTNESPEFMLRKKEFLQRYKQALSNLKEEERVAFLLSKVEGKTHKEIGALLNVTKKVAEHRIYAALNKLKNEIEELKKK